MGSECSECRFLQIEPYAGEFERRRFALLGFPEGLANQDSVPPFNGGAEGRYPQIRVLPPLVKSQVTSIYHLPHRL